MNGLLPIITRSGLFARPDVDAFDRLFRLTNRQAAHNWAPALDAAETDAAYIITAEIPGLAKEEIDITLTEGLLTIAGEKKEEQAGETGGVHIAERRYGAFSRTLRLPETIDVTKVTAAAKDGVLTITIPKTEEEKPRRIAIQG